MNTSSNPAALSDAPWHPYVVWWCRMGVRYGLLLPLFFLGVLAWVVRPGAKRAADDAASIPFKED